MIPETSEIYKLDESADYGSYASTTYRLDFTNKRIIGKVDGKEAVMQFIKKVLNTDKYAYSIYNWYYGNELNTLIGRPYDYVVTECPRIVTESLTADDRILDVQEFKIKQLSLDSLEVSCLVRTIFGTLYYSQEVSV